MLSTPRLPAPYPTLDANETLAGLVTLPPRNTSNILGAINCTWPSNGSPATCAVVDAGLRLFDSMFNNDAVVHRLALHCEPVDNPADPTAADVTSLELAEAKFPPVQIRQMILTNLPIVKVSKTNDHTFMKSTLDQHGPCLVTVTKGFMNECIKVDQGANETRKMWLAITFGVKLFHEIAHVLMFKCGFQNTLATPTTAFGTPGGLLKREAGDAFEHLVFRGVLTNMTQYKYTTEALCLHDVDVVTKYTIPLSWARTILSGSFWLTNPTYLSPSGIQAPGRTATDVIVRFPGSLLTPTEVFSAGDMEMPVHTGSTSSPKVYAAGEALI
ncbi:hypothetical protein HDU87_007584 [Geranomyces variabilis]|uniref:Uncharacterized protein n=1 Tax=Geranomyces variabilis TaxID=109894 RepID=A0AAD5TGG1_9FUNG|nr:hypothetical protein HDU87_007584 [Geranomyces variabilis]